MEIKKIKVTLADNSTKVFEGIFAKTDGKNNLVIYKSGVEVQAVIKASEWKTWEILKD